MPASSLFSLSSPSSSAGVPVPRYYQRQQIQALSDARDLGQMRVVVSAPTGVGKTFSMALAARELLDCDTDGTVLVCIPYLSLLDQTVKQFQNRFDRADIGVIQGDTREYGRKVLIASTATAIRPGVTEAILKAWKGCKPLIVDFDECHERSLTDDTKRLFDSLSGRETQIVGWSATHNRADRRSLKPVFSDGIVSYHSILEMVLNGFLVPIEGHDISTNLDLSDFSVDEEELAKNASLSLSLQKHIEQSNRYEHGYQGWKHWLGPTKRTLLFGHTVRDCYGWRDYVREKGQDCEVLESRHNMESRKSVLARLKSGELPLVINYDVLGTGLDMPEIEGIINARYNISKNKTIQHIGRGTRLCPEIGKEKCIFLNLTDTHHLLYVERDLLGMTTGSVDAYRRQLLAKEGTDAAERQEVSEERQPYEIHSRLKQIESQDYNVFTGNGWGYSPESDLYIKEAGPLGRLLVEGDFLGGYSVCHLSDKGRRTWLEQTNEKPVSALEAQACGAAHLEWRAGERAKGRGDSPDLVKPLLHWQWQLLKQRDVPRMGNDCKEAQDAGMKQWHYYDLAKLLDKKTGYGSAWEANKATGWKCCGLVQKEKGSNKEKKTGKGKEKTHG